MFTPLLFTLLSTTAAAAPNATLIGVLHQALPAQVPEDLNQKINCTATWSLQTDGSSSVRVEPGCPALADVEQAASQWRFGYVQLRDGGTSTEVSARFIYGDDTNGDVGWYYLWVPSALLNGVHEVKSTDVKPRIKVAPNFPSSLRKKGLSEVTCTSRFTVSERGRVEEILTYGCPEEAQIPALKAFSKWTFEPATVDAQPTRSAFIVVLHYDLK